MSDQISPAGNEFANKLQILREQLAAFDEQIIHVLKNRMDVARTIGHLKATHGRPIRCQETEDLVKERNRSFAASAGLPHEFADDLSDLMIRVAIRAQQDLTSP